VISDRYGIAGIINRIKEPLGPRGWVPILNFEDGSLAQVSALEPVSMPSHQYFDTYEAHGLRQCVVTIELTFDDEVAY